MWILDDKDALLEGAILASFISEMITSSAYKDSSADNLVSYHEYIKLFGQRFGQRLKLIIESF